MTSENLKDRLLNVTDEGPKDEIVLGSIREFIENIFDENEDKINWSAFIEGYSCLVSNNRGFNPAIRIGIISILTKGKVLSLKKVENYEVSFRSSSGLGEENAFYNQMGQGLFFCKKEDAIGFKDAFEKDEKKEATIYFIQEIKK